MPKIIVWKYASRSFTWTKCYAIDHMMLIFSSGLVDMPNSCPREDRVRESFDPPVTPPDLAKLKLSCESKDVTPPHGSVLQLPDASTAPIKPAVKPKKSHLKPKGHIKSALPPTTQQPVPLYQAGSPIDYPSLPPKPAGEVPGQSNNHHSLTAAGDGLNAYEPKKLQKDNDSALPYSFTAGVYTELDSSSSISFVSKSDNSNTVVEPLHGDQAAKKHSCQEAPVVVSGQRGPLHSITHDPTEMEARRSEHLYPLVTGISLHPDYSECRLSGVVEEMKNVSLICRCTPLQLPLESITT